MASASEDLIRLVDKLLEAAKSADREIDDTFRVLYDLDAEKKWDGYIIGSDSPLAIASAEISYLTEELDKLALDLRTIGEPR